MHLENMTEKLQHFLQYVLQAWTRLFCFGSLNITHPRYT